MIVQLVYVGCALGMFGWRFPIMMVSFRTHTIDISGIPDPIAAVALRKMRTNLLVQKLSQLLGEALIWPITLVVIAWMRVGVRPVIQAEGSTPQVSYEDVASQRVMASCPPEEEQLKQQRQVLCTLAPVLEHDLHGVHLAMVAVQLIGIARYKLKTLLAEHGIADPDSASSTSLRALTYAVAQSQMDDGALQEYLAAAKSRLP